MKRYIHASFILVILILLTSCSYIGHGDKVTNSDSQEAESEDISVTEYPKFASIKDNGPGEYIIATYPEVQNISSGSVRDKINDAIRKLALDDKAEKTGSIESRRAEDAEASMPMEDDSYYYRLEYIVLYNSNNIISIDLNSETYMNRAHPEHDSIICNFNVRTGEEYKLGGIFAEGADYGEILGGYIAEQFRDGYVDAERHTKVYPEASLIPSDLTVNDDQLFYFTDDSIVIVFTQGSLFPYSYGRMCVEVGYTYLADHLDEDILDLFKVGDNDSAAAICPEIADNENLSLTYQKSENEEDPKLAEAVAEAYGLTYEEAARTRYFYNHIDLNDDNVSEVFVQLAGPYTSGTGGDAGAIFTQEDGVYALFQKFTDIRNPIIVCGQMTNGWHDILMYVSGGGAEAYLAHMRFGSGKYPDPCDAPALDASLVISGKAILNNIIGPKSGIYLE
jgi:hypothetical protein